MALLHNEKEDLDQIVASVLRFENQIHNSIIVRDRISGIPT